MKYRQPRAPEARDDRDGQEGPSTLFERRRGEGGRRAAHRTPQKLNVIWAERTLRDEMTERHIP